MSRPSWQNSLTQKLQSLSQPERTPRVAIVGIGHELRGDDAAGVMAARALLAQQVVNHDSPLHVINAGSAPENVTGDLRHFAPDLVLFVDAAQMNKLPGTVRWLDWRETAGLSASTHTLPLHVIAEYLVNEIGCDVALIGIQPYDNAFGMPLSSDVRHAVREVVQGIQAALMQLTPA